MLVIVFKLGALSEIFNFVKIQAMKTNRTNLFIALLFIAFITSCSSDDDKDEVAPVGPSFETNTPPSGNYYSGVLYDDLGGYAAWTADFETYNKFTDEFNQVYNVKVENDTLLIAYRDIHQLHFIAYAPVDNLADFKVISSSEPIEEFSILNGVIIVYAVDGLNKYTGYASLNQSMTYVQYVSTLSPTVTFSGFTNTGNAIVASHQDNAPPNMAYTTDGITWNVSATISGGRFEVFDGLHLDSLNTTDTSGLFEGSFLDVNSSFNWRFYGSIFNGTTAYPALNISTNQGLTWSTQLLPSINSVDDHSNLYGEYYSINSLVIWKNTNTNSKFPIGVYSAANGIDFSYDSSQSAMDELSVFVNTHFVR